MSCLCRQAVAVRGRSCSATARQTTSHAQPHTQPPPLLPRPQPCARLTPCAQHQDAGGHGGGATAQAHCVARSSTSISFAQRSAERALVAPPSPRACRASLPLRVRRRWRASRRGVSATRPGQAAQAHAAQAALVGQAWNGCSRVTQRADAQTAPRRSSSAVWRQDAAHARPGTPRRCSTRLSSRAASSGGGGGALSGAARGVHAALSPTRAWRAGCISGCAKAAPSSSSGGTLQRANVRVSSRHQVADARARAGVSSGGCFAPAPSPYLFLF